MACATKGGVDDHSRRHGREELRDLGKEDRLVVEVLGHSQPSDRQSPRGVEAPRANEGEGGGEISHRVGRKAAHGPGWRSWVGVSCSLRQASRVHSSSSRNHCSLGWTLVSQTVGFQNSMRSIAP